jgi:hypothetical protein
MEQGRVIVKFRGHPNAHPGDLLLAARGNDRPDRGAASSSIVQQDGLAIAEGSPSRLLDRRPRAKVAPAVAAYGDDYWRQPRTPRGQLYDYVGDGSDHRY